MCVTAFVTSAAQAQTQPQWKWRDDKGQVHVSDLPPPRDVPEKDVLQHPDATARRAPTAASAAATTPSVAPVARPTVDAELEKRRKASEQEKAAKTKSDDDKLDAQRRENCSRARAHAAALDSGQRIARINDKGEREVLDDRGRADEMRRARDVIASDCR